MCRVGTVQRLGPVFVGARRSCGRELGLCAAAVLLLLLLLFHASRSTRESTKKKVENEKEDEFSAPNHASLESNTFHRQIWSVAYTRRIATRLFGSDCKLDGFRLFFCVISVRSSVFAFVYILIDINKRTKHTTFYTSRFAVCARFTSTWAARHVLDRGLD